MKALAAAFFENLTLQFIHCQASVTCLTQDVSIRSMRGFVKDYLDGKLQRFLRSAPLPADWNAGNVITLVASNFKEVAKDAAKNVFVFYYSPWSGK